MSVDQIIGIDDYRNLNASTICIGAFDGFHRGHQALVEHSEFMVTFDPHPRDVLSAETSSIQRLTLLNELRYFFSNLLIIPFSSDVAAMNADQFLSCFIAPLFPTRIVVGSDFRFGRHGMGNVEFLKAWGQGVGCEIMSVDIQHHDDQTPYKSSIIRKMIQESPNHAIELLGHPYLISGTVVVGDQRGARLGFPTANVEVSSNKCVPKFGVYASTAIVSGGHYDAITYVGKKPTFMGHNPIIETHILDGFSDQIYNQHMMVLLNKFIRDDQKFNSQDELVAQIKLDIATIQS